MGLYKATDVTPETVTRITSTYDELDWLFGKSKSWGLPKGRITLITGVRGGGKTRLLTQLIKGWDRLGWKTLMSQGEVSVGQFVAEKFEGYVPPNCYLCDGMGIEDQIDALATVSPAVAITDSVQQIEEFKGGKGAKDIIRKIRSVISHTGTHLILISQVTTTGTARGGSELPHEVDCESYLTKWAPNQFPNFVSLEIAKNRYGESGKEAIFCHKDEGLICQSQNRLKDEKWVAEHRSPARWMPWFRR